MRLPLPPATKQGSLYENQKGMKQPVLRDAAGRARSGDGEMSDRLPVEPIFDHTPHLFGDGPPDPMVYDASIRALRQRSVNFAAKRYADMMYVSGLDRATADEHFRPRAAPVPGGSERASRRSGAAEPRLPRRVSRADYVIDTDAGRPAGDRHLERSVVRRAGHRPADGRAGLWQHRARRTSRAAVRSEADRAHARRRRLTPGRSARRSKQPPRHRR